MMALAAEPIDADEAEVARLRESNAELVAALEATTRGGRGLSIAHWGIVRAALARAAAQ